MGFKGQSLRTRIFETWGSEPRVRMFGAETLVI